MSEQPLELLLGLDHDAGSAITPAPAHLVSWGLGVESSAYLTEVLSSPERYGIDFARMVVIHAVVGGEWNSTIIDAERFLLPMLAERGVRTVQIARGGPRDADGIVVLDDSRHPAMIHRRGPWTLEDESERSGTVPQLSHRRCSLKFKGWVLDQWIARFVGRQRYEHVIGYSVDELTRAKRDLVYATATRTPSHPLIEWGWTRAACSARLMAEFGVIWKKSACVFCPYSGGRSLESTMRRMWENPEEAVIALMLEAPAMMLNPNSKLYGTHSLLDRLIEDGNTAAIELFHRRLEARPWSVYDVRRVYFPAKDDPMRKGTAWRSVKPLFTGNAHQARALLRANDAGRPVGPDGRLWLRHQDEFATYPKAERFLVATVAGVREKERVNFTAQWQRITGEVDDLFSGAD
ncbi:hypothetical protein [Actinokineospora cianjurensis]|uniref:3'-phosphoadenosine 5'-phosphosulfate sulfotransferase (PAPS reductase)/FAD synthetase n=1 Tax=Actinokineospora cianjurensis TaxID=585224 RepID=A0A421B252_9PSEU|nr:hypothetical protein [Actinokineospora cianjurensis]RLK58465.1 hypothetical protein CLV68_4571 [Actinokineospora cianjurensis]